jgi:hypothetical protein
MGCLYMEWTAMITSDNDANTLVYVYAEQIITQSKLFEWRQWFKDGHEVWVL